MSVITIIENIVLSAVKMLAGIIAHSNAMISDAVHSASDVFSTFVVIFGIKLASKKLALIATIVSIISKEGMYWYTRYYAKKIDSGALMADAWHHRSDAFSSIGALI